MNGALVVGHLHVYFRANLYTNFVSGGINCYVFHTNASYIDHVPTFLHMSLQCSFWYVVDHRGIFDGRTIGHHGHGFLRVLSRPQFIMLDIPVLVITPVFSMMLFTVRFTSIVVLTIKSNPFIITRNVGGFAIKVIFRSIHFKSQKVNSTSMSPNCVPLRRFAFT